MSNHPLFVIFRSIRLLRQKKVSFSYRNLGRGVTREDGCSFQIFRQVILPPADGTHRLPGAVFRVWFTAKASPAFTIAMSWPAMLLFFGMAGFRAKTWLYNPQTNQFGGIYEWDTLEQAQAYGSSYAMRLSKRRSVPGMFFGEAFTTDDLRAAVHAHVRLAGETKANPGG